MSSILFSQDQFCYSEEEVKEIQQIIEECDFKDQVHLKVEQNLSQQLNNCEDIIGANERLAEELEAQLKLKDQLIKEIKPKWHENKYLWFGYGILSILLPTLVLNNVS
jgi:indole-3-glycerol phosphate synthase